MVKIEYVDGTEDTIETVGSITYIKSDGISSELIKSKYFRYEKDTQCFIVYDQIEEQDCMMIPREFVKSIRHIEV